MMDFSQLPIKDQKYMVALMKLKSAADKFKEENSVFASHLTQRLQTRGENHFLRFVDDDGVVTSVSYEEMLRRSNQVAQWASEQGLTNGDTVNLVSANSVLQVVLFVGFARVGIITSMVNYNLVSESLLHCLSLTGAKMTLFQAEFADHVSEIRGDLDHPLFVFDGVVDDFQSLETVLEQASEELPEPVDLNFDDTLCYIFTSGTTGLPKAVHCAQSKFLLAGFGFSTSIGLDENTVNFGSLPLYHSNALIVGFAPTLFVGGCLSLSKKFSASKFFRDITLTDSNTCMYIGEIWRYLANSPVSEYETTHKLIRTIGNGLREELWDIVQGRFGIGQIFEFYGATEGFTVCMNEHNEKGSIGYLPILLRAMLPNKIVKCDPDTGDLYRNEDGFCVLTGFDEPGHYLGQMSYPKVYTNENATTEKYVHNCFAEGDLYFRSGDLVRISSTGYMYFVDRIGDTFRWKGENVSTREVEQVLSELEWNLQSNVYGVLVPDTEGRAGMAQIQVNRDISETDLEELYQLVSSKLPPYAQPLFLRITKEDIDITGTFKHKKSDLRKEAFNLPSVDDIYFLDSREHKYVLVEEELLNKILSGNAGL